MSAPFPHDNHTMPYHFARPPPTTKRVSHAVMGAKLQESRSNQQPLMLFAKQKTDAQENSLNANSRATAADEALQLSAKQLATAKKMSDDMWTAHTTAQTSQEVALRTLNELEERAE